MTASPLASSADGPTRTPLRIDIDRGRLESGGQRATFDPAVEDAALIAYLKLVRRLRDVEREPSFVLRRDEVVVLASALRQDAVVVLDRLGELMGATATQRRSMVTAFLAGALLIAVATGATALAPADGTGPVSIPTRGERSDAIAAAVFDAARVDAPPVHTSRDGVPSARTDAASSSDADSRVPRAGATAVTGPTVGHSSPPSTAPADQADEGGSVRGTGSVVAGRPAVARQATDRVTEADPDRVDEPQGPRGPRREIVQPGATIDIPIPDEPSTDGPALPGGELPGGELPGDELPGGELPGDELPGDELPGDDYPVSIPTDPGSDADHGPVAGPPGPPGSVRPPGAGGPPPEEAAGNKGIGRGNGGGNGTGNEGNGVGPRGR